MRKNFALLLALFLVLALASVSVAAKKTGTGKKSLENTVPVTGKITHLNTAACKVSVMELNGQATGYQVAPEVCPSLSQYKVGDAIAATSQIDTTTGRPVLWSLDKSLSLK